jgi:Zn-dependent peptidase ImmA (M78 family)
MIVDRNIAREALRVALRVRRHAGINKALPICIYDLAERLGVEVKFVGGSSFGGMYEKTRQTILVPALRPPGRQAFTAAHELAHWAFEHGTRVDRIEDFESLTSVEPEERAANLFAGYLLMPLWAIEDAFFRRKWEPERSTPLQIYAIACQFGVGYRTLIQHLRWSLNMLSSDRAEELLRTSPKLLRQSLVGASAVRHLIVAGPGWISNVPIDLAVGDVAIVPRGVHVDGSCARVTARHDLGELIEAVSPGIGRAATEDDSWATFLRVARKEFTGRSIYRYMEDPDVNATS